MSDGQVQKLSRLRLDDFPIPPVARDSSKEERGVVLVIGGSDRVPGAIKLAGIGALRAGAGKLQLATSANIATVLGVNVPEALVASLEVTADGEVDPESAPDVLADFVAKADAVLLGPGMALSGKSEELVRWIIGEVSPHATLVIDGPILQALALDDTMLHALNGRAILTPHAGEMAALLEIPRDEVSDAAEEIAEHSANRFRATVVFKGAETWISAIDAIALCYRDGKAGLGTSGSGDVLAGVIAGLAARGASTMAACAWAVWAHGSAGNKLARSVAPTGFLASELLSEIPALLHR